MHTEWWNEPEMSEDERDLEKARTSVKSNEQRACNKHYVRF